MSMAAYSSPSMFYREMRGPIVFSAILHVAIIVGGAVSLPYIKKPPPIIQETITVEIIEEERSVTKPPRKTLGKDESVSKKKTPKAPPKVVAKEMPKSVVTKKQPKDLKPVQKATSDVPLPSQEKLKKPPPKTLKKPDKKEVVKVDNEKAFMSVLKNLQDSKPQVEEELPIVAKTSPEPSPLEKFSQRMTMSEADALRQQLARCWSIQVGAKYAEDLVVEVKLVMNPDRTVRNATILDKGRYNRDGFFKAAADSAMRAIRSPLCTPLDLPPDKYEMWKDIVVTFDPREML